MSRRTWVYKIWSGLVMFGISTELLIWGRKGKRKHINFAGGIFEFCNGARKQFAYYRSCVSFMHVFLNQKWSTSVLGKVLPQLSFVCGQVWFFSFLFMYIDNFLGNQYILGKLSTFSSSSVEMYFQIIWFSQNPRVTYKETLILACSFALQAVPCVFWGPPVLYWLLVFQALLVHLLIQQII